MRRLSGAPGARHDGYYLLAIVVLGVAAFWAARGTGHPPSWRVLLPWMGVIAVVLPARLSRLFARGVVDEVWVEEGGLLLKRDEQTVRMPLSDIAAVDADRSSDLVTLGLYQPCALGGPVRFIARRGAARDVSAELRQHIAEARRQA